MEIFTNKLFLGTAAYIQQTSTLTDPQISLQHKVNERNSDLSNEIRQNLRIIRDSL